MVGKFGLHRIEGDATVLDNDDTSLVEGVPDVWRE